MSKNIYRIGDAANISLYKSVNTDASRYNIIILTRSLAQMNKKIYRIGDAANVSLYKSVNTDALSRSDEQENLPYRRRCQEGRRLP